MATKVKVAIVNTNDNTKPPITIKSHVFAVPSDLKDNFISITLSIISYQFFAPVFAKGKEISSLLPFLPSEN
jgi:hypothetical protein